MPITFDRRALQGSGPSPEVRKAMAEAEAKNAIAVAEAKKAADATSVLRAYVKSPTRQRPTEKVYSAGFESIHSQLITLFPLIPLLSKKSDAQEIKLIAPNIVNLGFSFDAKINEIIKQHGLIFPASFQAQLSQPGVFSLILSYLNPGVYFGESPIKSDERTAIETEVDKLITILEGPEYQSQPAIKLFHIYNKHLRPVFVTAIAALNEFKTLRQQNEPLTYSEQQIPTIEATLAICSQLLVESRTQIVALSTEHPELAILDPIFTSMEKALTSAPAEFIRILKETAKEVVAKQLSLPVSVTPAMEATDAVTQSTEIKNTSSKHRLAVQTPPAKKKEILVDLEVFAEQVKNPLLARAVNAILQQHRLQQNDRNITRAIYAIHVLLNTNLEDVSDVYSAYQEFVLKLAETHPNFSELLKNLVEELCLERLHIILQSPKISAQQLKQFIDFLIPHANGIENLNTAFYKRFNKSLVALTIESGNNATFSLLTKEYNLTTNTEETTPLISKKPIDAETFEATTVAGKFLQPFMVLNDKFATQAVVFAATNFNSQDNKGKKKIANTFYTAAHNHAAIFEASIAPTTFWEQMLQYAHPDSNPITSFLRWFASKETLQKADLKAGFKTLSLPQRIGLMIQHAGLLVKNDAAFVDNFVKHFAKLNAISKLEVVAKCHAELTETVLNQLTAKDIDGLTQIIETDNHLHHKAVMEFVHQLLLDGHLSNINALRQNQPHLFNSFYKTLQSNPIDALDYLIIFVDANKTDFIDRLGVNFFDAALVRGGGSETPACLNDEKLLAVWDTQQDVITQKIDALFDRADTTELLVLVKLLPQTFKNTIGLWTVEKMQSWLASPVFSRKLNLLAEFAPAIFKAALDGLPDEKRKQLYIVFPNFAPLAQPDKNHSAANDSTRRAMQAGLGVPHKKLKLAVIHEDTTTEDKTQKAEVKQVATVAQAKATTHAVMNSSTHLGIKADTKAIVIEESNPFTALENAIKKLNIDPQNSFLQLIKRVKALIEAQKAPKNEAEFPHQLFLDLTKAEIKFITEAAILNLSSFEKNNLPFLKALLNIRKVISVFALAHSGASRIANSDVYSYNWAPTTTLEKWEAALVDDEEESFSAPDDFTSDYLHTEDELAEVTTTKAAARVDNHQLTPQKENVVIFSLQLAIANHDKTQSNAFYKTYQKLLKSGVLESHYNNAPQALYKFLLRLLTNLTGADKAAFYLHLARNYPQSIFLKAIKKDGNLLAALTNPMSNDELAQLVLVEQSLPKEQKIVSQFVLADMEQCKKLFDIPKREIQKLFLVSHFLVENRDNANIIAVMSDLKIETEESTYVLAANKKIKLPDEFFSVLAHSITKPGFEKSFYAKNPGLQDDSAFHYKLYPASPVSSPSATVRADHENDTKYVPH